MTSRDIKQKECVDAWINNKCVGTIVAPVGLGKTRIAISGIKRFLAKNKSCSVLVVVPTEHLRNQWIKDLILENLPLVRVEIINSVIKNDWVVDLLVLDEAHLYASEKHITVFDKVKYKIIMCLTATLSRLDKRDELITSKSPVVIDISLKECLDNNWVSKFKEYKILLNVDNIDEYTKVNKEFYNHFSFFNFDFNEVMSCVGVTGYVGREMFLKKICSDPAKYQEMRKVIMLHTVGFMNTLKKRKSFIYNHPKKIEIANLIIEHRADKKGITFSKTIANAEKIKHGYTLHSKISKKKRAMTMEEFRNLKRGFINTSKALTQGIDIPGLEVAIFLGSDSSITNKTQSRGRVIRYSEDKEAEIFTLVIKNTVEEEWVRRSNPDTEFITLDERNLINFLDNKEYDIIEELDKRMLYIQ